ncbi:MAG: PspA/IM30 family protein [Planctomycetota bacterium]|nr:PspA/IM30 family protein [Planctomycetota bacterium]
MGILGRVSDILVIDVDEWLDRCESPEAMLAQVLREMDEKIAETRRAVARSIAWSRRLDEELGQHRRSGEEWVRKAFLAIDKGKDEMAREALERKREHEDLAIGLEIECQAARGDCVTYERTLRALQAKRAVTQRKEETLAARRKNADTRSDIASLSEIFSESSGARTRIQRMEDRVEDLEARVAEAADRPVEDPHLKAAYMQLDGRPTIDEELEGLKRRVHREGEPVVENDLK